VNQALTYAALQTTSANPTHAMTPTKDAVFVLHCINR